MSPGGGRIVGVLLAAGAGQRAGGPKALRHGPDGTSWLVSSVAVLLAGGCDEVVVVLGCEAGAARGLLDQHPWAAADRAALTVAEALDWATGMGASLRAGLLAADSAAPPSQPPLTAVVVHLVDLPDVTAAVVQRLLDQAPPATDVLARATYHGVPGHPVLIGADHLRPMTTELAGDQGARSFLDRRSVHAVDCGDLATGRDRDWSDDNGLSADPVCRTGEAEADRTNQAG